MRKGVGGDDEQRGGWQGCGSGQREDSGGKGIGWRDGEGRGDGKKGEIRSRGKGQRDGVREGMKKEKLTGVWSRCGVRRRRVGARVKGGGFGR